MSIFKVLDYLLCSAQDHHPGESSVQQHFWKTTLAPDAVVFVSHLPCLSEEGSHRSNFRRGKVTPPRVTR
jgi:hypothetical protein